jgi:hypothetical protein
MPIIPKAKNPGTILSTVAPHEDALYNAPFVAAAVLTCVEIGPTSETPIRMATKPPIKLAIISFFLRSYKVYIRQYSFYIVSG